MHISPFQNQCPYTPLIFLWTPKGFISPGFFLNFFLNLYILPRLHKSFKFTVLRLLSITFVSQKIEPVHFYSCPQANSLLGYYYYTPLPAPSRKKLPIPPEQRFLKIYIFPEEKGRIMALKK